MKRMLAFLRKLVPGVAQACVVAAILLSAFIAYDLGARSREPVSVPASPLALSPQANHPADTNGDGTIYTCSMHPQIQMDEPGTCPICAMELVPLEVTGSDTAGHDHAAEGESGGPIGYACAMNCVPPLSEPGKCPVCGMEMQPVFEEISSSPATGDPTRRLAMTPEAVALASIRTTPVVRRVPKRDVRLVGTLAVDPSRRAHISADVGGRIDELAADYEGDLVQVGEDLVLLYSPELLAVQREFLQAVGSLERLSADAPEGVRRGASSAADAARERLRLAGLGEERVAELASGGVAQERVVIEAPIGGTVMERHAEIGEYVAKGAPILTITDLGVLWAEMEAYESDLPWLRVGQPVVFESEAFPGEIFRGEVAWIDPMTATRARTTRVRMNVANDEGRLRPGMYLTAHVAATPGDGATALVIPETAPLITGKRAVVYVEVPGADRPTFEGREVVLGSRIDDGYIVSEGLREGERVVTNGAFRIDASLQIVAKPSMMNSAGGGVDAHSGHGGHAQP